MTKQTICAVPWMHLNFEPNGKVIPCCLTSVHNYFAGDLNHQTIDEIWNSDNMKTLRKDMIEGKEPEVCRKAQNHSLTQFHLQLLSCGVHSKKKN